MTSADVYEAALTALTTACDAPTKDDAVLDVRAQMQGLDEAALRRVAGCLAVETVWRPKADRAEVRRWVDRVRLEVTWQSPAGDEEVSR